MICRRSIHVAGDKVWLFRSDRRIMKAPLNVLSGQADARGEPTWVGEGT